MARQPSSSRRDAQITIRIPGWLRDAIEAEAERDRRTLADVIVFALEDKFKSKKGSK